MRSRLVFLLIVISVLTSIQFYIGRRLVTQGDFSDATKSLLWGLLWTLLFFEIAAPIAFRLSRELGWAGDVLQWAGYLSLGFAALLFSLLVLRDAGALISGPLLRRLGYGVDAERRRFLKGIIDAGLVAAAGGLGAVGFAQARRVPPLTRHQVRIPGLHPDLQGLRIAQISDLHLGPTLKRDWLEALIDRVLEAKADIIAVTGDLVDGYVDQMGPMLEPLGRLKAPKGVYFVTGNHEYYWGADEWTARVRELGVKPLDNEHVLLNQGRARLLLAGVTDHSAGGFNAAKASDPARALAGAGPHDLRILLAHQPRSVFAAAEAGYHLQISGHTHGGQFLPWTFLVGLAQPFVAGLHKVRDTQIFVSCGSGYWGPPLRLGAPNEVALLELSGA